MGVVEEPGLMQRHRVTVAEYDRMTETGVLAPDARVELIEGGIVDMAPMKSGHAAVVNELFERLVERTKGRANAACQTPLRLGKDSEPQPDLMLLKLRADRYRPGMTPVALLPGVGIDLAGLL